MNSTQLRNNLLAFLLTVNGTSAFAINGTETPDRPSARGTDAPTPLPNQPPPSFILPSAPSAHSSEPPKKAFIIGEFCFEGHSTFKTEELRRIAAPFTGKPISIADLEELRQRLTHYYIDHGYINSGAIVPYNPLKKGAFRYQVVEGQLDGIRLKGQGRLRESYIKNRLLKESTQPFNINTLQENFQLLLTDPLITRMNGRLQPGAALGHSFLDVDVTHARPYQLSVFSNNYRPPSIGGEAVSGSGSVRNLTGLGDFLNLSFTISEGSTRYFGLWSVPVNDDGTQVYFQFDEGNSSVIEEPLNNINIDSKVHNLEGGINHPVIDSLKRRVTIGGTFAVRENETRLLGEPFSFVKGLDDAHNQATVVWLSQDWIERWERQAISLRSTFSVGLDALGSTPEKNTSNPDSEFFAWLGQVQFVRRVLDNGAQSSSTKVLRSTPSNRNCMMVTIPSSTSLPTASSATMRKPPSLWPTTT